jgi:hypothetical protein
MSEILHVSYLPNGSFVLPIIGALQRSSNPKVRALAGSWRSSGLARLGASLSTKATMLGLLGRRLYSKVGPLEDELEQLRNLSEHLAGGYAWTPTQRQLPYEVLLELDAFIFEFRSAYEILGKFLVEFSKRILGKTVKEEDLLRILSAAGINISWARELQNRRKFWFHEHAPWLVYKISNPDPLDAELIFLAHVDADPFNDNEALSLRSLNLIYAGFDRALQELQSWVLSEISSLEATTSG